MVVRSRGAHIIQTIASQMAVKLSALCADRIHRLSKPRDHARWTDKSLALYGKQAKRDFLCILLPELHTLMTSLF